MTGKVDFFIVGSPKCGTTALAQILEQHPDIVISAPKEPHYFCPDLNTGGYMPTDDADYHAYFFPPTKADGALWGEASVWNLYSDVALERIRAYNPDAKIIALLRDPARAAFSLHQQMIYQNREDELNFLDAWERSAARFQREEFPVSRDLDPKLVAYRHAYDYGPQLERVYSQFPAENIRIFRQEDWRANKAETLKEVTTFIGASEFQYDMPIVNKSRYIDNPVLTKLFRSTAAKKTAGTLRKILGVKSLGIGRPSARIQDDYIERVHADISDNLKQLNDRFGLNFQRAGKG